MIELTYEERDGWPPLAWVARCDRGGPVRVLHGPQVETRDAWFCEAVWDGSFEEGGFDRTEVVCGSGGRVRDDRLVLVSSFATVDRLHLLRSPDGLLASNSLAALVEVAGASVDPTYPDYLYDFRSITGGVRDYERFLQSDRGPVELVYYDNVVWDGSRASVRAKPEREAPFSDFGGYREFLVGRLRKLQRNLADGARDRPLRMLGTISSGYDSPAVCALAARVGLEEAVNFTTARGGKPDSGAEAGRHLGIDVIPRSMEAWKEIPGAEIPILAGAATAGEIYFEGAENLLPGRVLLTGQGGSIWRTGRHHQRLGSDLSRSDPSGLSLTEYRLWAGFQQLPVTHIGARHADRIHEITLSEEMRPWHRGGYNKPIPRRICEEAGVPADAFGQAKRYGAVSFGQKETFWTAPSVEDYLRWLRERSGAWWRRGRLPPLWISRLAAPFQAGARAAARLLDGIRDPADPVRRVRKRLRFLGTREYLYKFVFPWALDRAGDRYSDGEASRGVP